MLILYKILLLTLYFSISSAKTTTKTPSISSGLLEKLKEQTRLEKPTRKSKIFTDIIEHEASKSNHSSFRDHCYLKEGNAYIQTGATVSIKGHCRMVTCFEDYTMLSAK